ncbi:hypothetical protein RW115_01280 [Macrococcus capreoli]
MDWNIFWITFIAAFAGSIITAIVSFIIYHYQRKEEQVQIDENRSFNIILKIKEDVLIVGRSTSNLNILIKTLMKINDNRNIEKINELIDKISIGSTSIDFNIKLLSNIMDLNDMQSEIKQQYNAILESKNKNSKLLDEYNENYIYELVKIIGEDGRYNVDLSKYNKIAYTFVYINNLKLFYLIDKFNKTYNKRIKH